MSVGRPRAPRGPNGPLVFFCALALLGLAAKSVTAQNFGQASSQDGGQRQVPPPAHYAITNATLVTVSGRIIENGTIVVNDGVIQAIGRNVDVPPGAWEIDGEGLTVYPGLLDGLTTLGTSESALAGRRPGAAARPGGGPGGAPGGGAGSAADFSRGPQDRPATRTWLNAADDLDAADSRFEQWRNAGFTSAVTVPDQGFFPGQAALINLAGERSSDLVVQTSVGLRWNVTGGRGHRGYPGSLMGSIAYARQLFLDAEHYRISRAMYDENPLGLERPGYDRALEPLGAVLRGELPVFFPANTRNEIQRALHLSEEFGVRPILYGVQRGYEAVDDLRGRNVPVVISLDWPAEPGDPDPDADTQLETLRFRLMAPTTPAALHEAGIPFTFFSAGVASPSDAIAGVRTAVEAGLPADAAIRALTLGAAEIFGVDNRVGSLDVGKIANLVVTEGALLDEGSEVKMVLVDGRRFEIDADAPAGPRMAGGRSGGPGGPGRRAGARRPGGGQGGAMNRGADREDPESPEEGDEAEAAVERPSDEELRSRITTELRGPYRHDDVTVIQNATILTVTKGTIEGGSILIRDGRIQEVGADVSVPRGAHVIDAEGQFVMPGIIDAHSHIAGGGNEGSVSVSSMVGIEDVINPDDGGIYRALAGGVTTANVLHGSANPIGGKNAVLKMRWGSNAQELLLAGAPPGIKFALGENPKRDRNPDRYPSTRMGVMDVIRQAFVEASEYQAQWDSYEAAQARGDRVMPPRRDLKLESLAEILRGERLVHAHSYRADEILQLLRLAEEFGFRIATFQHVLEGYKVAKELAEHGAGASTFSDWWAYKVEAYDAIPYNAAIMVEKDVVVSINSDSGEEMRHLNQEAAKTIKWGGLSETEALSLITINPALQLGIDEWVGSIEVGKDADLVIYDRHPLSSYATVQQTFVDGMLYFDKELDAVRQAALEAEKEALQEGRPGTEPKPRVTTQQVAPGQISNEEVDR